MSLSHPLCWSTLQSGTPTAVWLMLQTCRLGEGTGEPWGATHRETARGRIAGQHGEEVYPSLG